MNNEQEPNKIEQTNQDEKDKVNKQSPTVKSNNKFTIYNNRYTFDNYREK